MAKSEFILESGLIPLYHSLYPLLMSQISNICFKPNGQGDTFISLYSRRFLLPLSSFHTLLFNASHLHSVQGLDQAQYSSEVFPWIP